MCEVGLACTTWAVQEKGAGSSSDSSIVIVLAQKTLAGDGIANHHRQDAGIPERLPLRLSAHFHLAKGDPQPTLCSNLEVAALNVPTESEELLMHGLCSSLLEAQVRRNAAEVLLETILQQPMTFVPGWFEQLGMLRHGVHAEEPP